MSCANDNVVDPDPIDATLHALDHLDEQDDDAAWIKLSPCPYAVPYDDDNEADPVGALV